MFLIDDTSSSVTRPRSLAHRRQLKSAFLNMLRVHRTTTDVRVAALRHGAILPANREWFRFILTDQERKDLGGRRGGPYMFSPDPNAPGRLLTNPVAPFKAPSQLSPTLVAKAIEYLDIRGLAEYLYPGIDLARQMIEEECPPGPGTPTPTPPGAGTPTPTAKPWCQRKVIVVLGDGDPGLAAADYYGTVARVQGKFPEQLLDRVKAAGIALHTLCAGNACTEKISRSDWWHGHSGACSNSRSAAIVCVAYRGGDLMRELAEYTGGEFHGYVP